MSRKKFFMAEEVKIIIQKDYFFTTTIISNLNIFKPLFFLLVKTLKFLLEWPWNKPNKVSLVFL